MRVTLALLAVSGAAGVCFVREEPPRPADVSLTELKVHVTKLASPEFLGRRGPGAARAARYVADAFEKLGLRPAFGDSYFQSIPSQIDDGELRRDSFIGRNVAAMVPGTDPVLEGEWVVLSAHYDHLGKRGDVLYPGADDNATGVAMLLEVARRYAAREVKPKRAVYFVAFDLEEDGLLGATHFALNPPRELRRLKAFLTADMLGRSMAGVMDEYVFVLGSESSPRLRRLLERVPPEEGLKVGRLGADLIGTRSDYGPFRDRRVPYLFFSTGQHPDYHRPGDTADKIDYAKLRRITRWIAELTDRLADDAEAPEWDAKGLPPDLDEVRTVRELVQRVLARPEKYPLTERKRELVRGVEQRLSAILERGMFTEDDRSWLLWTARLLLITVF
jgi:hypothetical protein